MLTKKVVGDGNWEDFYQTYDKNKDNVLSVSEAKKVTEISMGSQKEVNQLKYFPNLKELGCFNIGLKKLDVSKNTKLTSLVCDNNKLKTLDISKNKNLKYLYCPNNKIKKLDISKNKKLKLSNIGTDYSVTLVGLKNYKKKLDINIKEQSNVGIVVFYAKKSCTLKVTYTFAGNQKFYIDAVKFFDSKTKLDNEGGFPIETKKTNIKVSKSKKVHSVSFKVKATKGRNQLSIVHVDEDGNTKSGRKLNISAPSASLVLEYGGGQAG